MRTCLAVLTCLLVFGSVYGCAAPETGGDEPAQPTTFRSPTTTTSEPAPSSTPTTTEAEFAPTVTSEHRPEPKPQPEPEPRPEPAGVSYPYPPDLDCDEIEERDFRVQEGDPHGFDGNDNDGFGCES